MEAPLATAQLWASSMVGVLIATGGGLHSMRRRRACQPCIHIHSPAVLHMEGEEGRATAPQDGRAVRRNEPSPRTRALDLHLGLTTDAV